METALPLSRLRLTIRAAERIMLPPYKGSALRGGFGHAFRRVVCAVKKRTCDDCLLRHTCAYSYVFETPPPPDTEIMRKYPTAPHPFVIEPPGEDKQVYEPGEALEFSLILIGRGRDYLPYFVYAFEELGKSGIGRGKGRYRLEQIRSGDEQEVIYTSDTRTLRHAAPLIVLPLPHESVNRLILSFQTPTRLKYEEQLTADPEFHVLIRTLLRRISSLSYFHADNRLTLDFTGMIGRATAVKAVRKDLSWTDWERYSSRQDARMKMGGFVGEMEFEGDLTEFMPLLRIGEIVHIGKATSFGLGKFSIQEASRA